MRIDYQLWINSPIAWWSIGIFWNSRGEENMNRSFASGRRQQWIIVDSLTMGLQTHLNKVRVIAPKYRFRLNYPFNLQLWDFPTFDPNPISLFEHPSQTSPTTSHCKSNLSQLDLVLELVAAGGKLKDFERLLKEDSDMISARTYPCTQKDLTIVHKKKCPGGYKVTSIKLNI